MLGPRARLHVVLHLNLHLRLHLLVKACVLLVENGFVITWNLVILKRKRQVH